jgi:hypothetical protein
MGVKLDLANYGKNMWYKALNRILISLNSCTQCYTFILHHKYNSAAFQYIILL